jgi:hypothetical protein
LQRYRGFCRYNEWVEKRPSSEASKATNQTADEAETATVNDLPGTLRLIESLRKEGFTEIYVRNSKDGNMRRLEMHTMSIEPSINRPSTRENDFVDYDIGPIMARATEVIGDRDEALRWLGTPVRGLDFATPISLLGTEEGATRVNDILGQMEHGIW